ncbi:Fc.00g033430.m01.CDS01 [Cosmosporella sp. VM-42]
MGANGFEIRQHSHCGGQVRARTHLKRWSASTLSTWQDLQQSGGNGPSTGNYQCKEPVAEGIYDGGLGTSAKVVLRIGNGGAGQTGLVKLLAGTFVKGCVAQGDALSELLDAAITYNVHSEQIAMNAGLVTKPSYSIFRDHFLLVVPPSNPAKLDPSSTIEEMSSTPYTVYFRRKDCTPGTVLRSVWQAGNEYQRLGALGQYRPGKTLLGRESLSFEADDLGSMGYQILLQVPSLYGVSHPSFESRG